MMFLQLDWLGIQQLSRNIFITCVIWSLSFSIFFFFSSFFPLHKSVVLYCGSLKSLKILIKCKINFQFLVPLTSVGSLTQGHSPIMKKESQYTHLKGVLVISEISFDIIKCNTHTCFKIKAPKNYISFSLQISIFFPKKVIFHVSSGQERKMI